MVCVSAAGALGGASDTLPARGRQRGYLRDVLHQGARSGCVPQDRDGPDEEPAARGMARDLARGGRRRRRAHQIRARRRHPSPATAQDQARTAASPPGRSRIRGRRSRVRRRRPRRIRRWPSRAARRPSRAARWPSGAARRTSGAARWTSGPARWASRPRWASGRRRSARARRPAARGEPATRAPAARVPAAQAGLVGPDRPAQMDVCGFLVGLQQPQQ